MDGKKVNKGEAFSEKKRFWKFESFLTVWIFGKVELKKLFWNALENETNHIRLKFYYA